MGLMAIAPSLKKAQIKEVKKGKINAEQTKLWKIEY
jgi:hypothetical protein